MQINIEERVLTLAGYIIESGATVRAAAAHCGVSKSTVHKDMTERLPRIDRRLARQVRRILDCNKAQRHLRGGEATRRKYRVLRLNRTAPAQPTEKRSPDGSEERLS